MTTGFLEAGGHRLEYTWIDPAVEAAPTLVFLHEGLGCLSLWRDFPARLAAATGCGALIYSRAGYGGSAPIALPRSGDYLHREAGVLREIIQQLGIHSSILVGHSDGASIALIYAANRPLPGLAGLILEAPHVFVEDITLQGLAAAAELYHTTDLRERLARHHGENTEAAFWGWNDTWRQPGFKDWNIEGLLRRIQAPILLVQGEEDEYGSVAQLQAIEQQSGGSVETLLLPDCGHTPHRDQPERVLAEMLEFIRRQLRYQPLERV